MSNDQPPVESSGRKQLANEQPPKRDFVEALARGLDVLTAFGSTRLALTVSEVATVTGLPRPTARRLLLTLETLGYLRSLDGVFSLTTQVLQLGTSIIASQGLWDIAQPHMVNLVSQTGESTSMAQLDGSDIVYTARVPVPKIIALAVHIGTRFPAPATSLGRVLLADLAASDLDDVLALPSRSGIIPRVELSRTALNKLLRQVRKRGWSLSDELLSLGIRSIAAPVIDANGRTVAAMNVTVHAAETSLETLTNDYLPLLLEAVDHVSAELKNLSRLPTTNESLDG